MGDPEDDSRPQRDQEPRTFLEAIEVVEAADVPWEEAERIITAISTDYIKLIGVLETVVQHVTSGESQQRTLAIKEVKALLKSVRREQERGAKLKESALRDDVTGLFRQKWFKERLARLFEETEDPYIGIVILDLRLFKQVNKRFGYEAGSKLLEIVGKLLPKQIRSKLDFVARYGGDEFVFVLRHLPHRGIHGDREELERGLVGVCKRVKEAIQETDWSTISPVFGDWKQGADMGAFITELGPRSGRVGRGKEFVEDVITKLGDLMQREKERATEAGELFSYIQEDVVVARDRIVPKDEADVMKAEPPKMEPGLQMRDKK